MGLGTLFCVFDGTGRDFLFGHFVYNDNAVVDDMTFAIEVEEDLGAGIVVLNVYDAFVFAQ